MATTGHFCLNAIDFSVPKISVFVLLVCSKLDWHKTLKIKYPAIKMTFSKQNLSKVVVSL
jgi:hypothetical protein